MLNFEDTSCSNSSFFLFGIWGWGSNSSPYWKTRWCSFSSETFIKVHSTILLIPRFWLMHIFRNNPPLNVSAKGNMKSKVVLAQLHSCFVELCTVFSFTLLILCILDDIFAHTTSLYTLEIDMLWHLLCFKNSLYSYSHKFL